VLSEIGGLGYYRIRVVMRERLSSSDVLAADEAV
jgi:hypothetical protein